MILPLTVPLDWDKAGTPGRKGKIVSAKLNNFILFIFCRKYNQNLFNTTKLKYYCYFYFHNVLIYEQHSRVSQCLVCLRRDSSRWQPGGFLSFQPGAGQGERPPWKRLRRHHPSQPGSILPEIVWPDFPDAKDL